MNVSIGDDGRIILTLSPDHTYEIRAPEGEILHGREITRGLTSLMVQTTTN